MHLSALPPANPDSLRVASSPAARRDTISGDWIWDAPDRPGLTVIHIVSTAGHDTMTLNVFTMVPSTSMKGGMLNGYHIGSYPIAPEGSQTPRGFIEATPSNAGTRVSPHLTLGQFLCKQASGFPKYLVLTEDLVLYLEDLLAAVNRAGHRVSTFTVLSGYRTPHHNRNIGNVRHSQHLRGTAADIFVDERPSDGIMDDLNRDGRTNRKDAEVICGIVESLEASGRQPGGLASYPSTDYHGPFVHVDVRGKRARW